MQYECVSARFLFFNGKLSFTVEYSYGTSTWFVFEDDKDRDALWWHKIDPKKSKTPSREEARGIFDRYLEFAEFITVNGWQKQEDSGMWVNPTKITAPLSTEQLYWTMLRSRDIIIG